MLEVRTEAIERREGIEEVAVVHSRRSAHVAARLYSKEMPSSHSFWPCRRARSTHTRLQCEGAAQQQCKLLASREGELIAASLFTHCWRSEKVLQAWSLWGRKRESYALIARSPVSTSGLQLPQWE